MEQPYNRKEIPRSIAVFGANGRIGGPVAEYIAEHDPECELRLVSHSDRGIEALRAKFPGQKYFKADYYDLASLEPIFRNLEGAFVVTPDFTNEERAMTNFIHAARRSSRSIIQIVRLIADPPGMELERVPYHMKHSGGGTAVQHITAKELLKNSHLPVTFINIGAYFMQNFCGHIYGAPLKEHRILANPRDRRMGFIDTKDIGHCAAAILLSDNHRHLGQTYHLDNGQDVMRFEEVAKIMTEVFGEPIAFDGSDETYLKYAYERIAKLGGRAKNARYFLDYAQFEQDNETVWRKSDIVEYLLGRPAKSLREWLAENRHQVLGTDD